MDRGSGPPHTLPNHHNLNKMPKICIERIFPLKNIAISNLDWSGVWTGITVDYDDDTIKKFHYTFGDMDGCTKHREMIVNLACGDDYRIMGQIDESEQG